MPDLDDLEEEPIDIDKERERRSIGALERLIKYPEWAIYKKILDGQIKARSDQLIVPLTSETVGAHNQMVGEIIGLNLAKELAEKSVETFNAMAEYEQLLNPKKKEER